MTNEGKVTASLTITNGNLNYRSYPQQFNVDVAGAKGPVPGAISAAKTGTTVDLAQLTTPALCRITNLSTTNFVEYGMSDGVEFYAFGEVLPGEFYIFRFSRYLFSSLGTGAAPLQLTLETSSRSGVSEPPAMSSWRHLKHDRSERTKSTRARR